MSDKATFHIKYDGLALENNEMEVRDLAPSLVAIADLLEESNSILNGGSAKVSVNVRGSFKDGSFGIDLTLIQDVYQQVIDFFNSEGIIAATALLQLLGLDGIAVIKNGLIPLIKRIRNRKILKIKKKEGVDRVTIIVEDYNGAFEEIETNRNVLQLLKSHKIRKAIEEVVTCPLDRDGVDTFAITDEIGKKSIEVKKPERYYFKAPEPEDEFLGETVTEAYLQIVSLSFKKNNMWRFSRGESVFYATIEDEIFLAGVHRNEIRFSKDDILKVRLRIIETLTEKGIDTDHYVEEVLEYRSAARQLKLPMEENNDGD